MVQGIEWQANPRIIEARPRVTTKLVDWDSGTSSATNCVAATNGKTGVSDSRFRKRCI